MEKLALQCIDHSFINFFIHFSLIQGHSFILHYH